MDIQTKERMHFGIAERGKIHFLEGNHREALRHFQEAIQMSVKNSSSDIFFQHYTQCVMESLEYLGHHNEVISYCEKLCEFLKEKDMEETIIRKNYATTREKMGIQYLLKEEKEEAMALLKEATELMDKKMPLSNTIIGWINRGYNVSEKQIRDAQHKHEYFAVRKDCVNPEMAIDLPNMNSVPSI
jgi:tetratricopeptide (TPR) repeat protein